MSQGRILAIGDYIEGVHGLSVVTGINEKRSSITLRPATLEEIEQYREARTK